MCGRRWTGVGLVGRLRLSGVAVDCRGVAAEFVTKRHAGFACGLKACHMDRLLGHPHGLAQDGSPAELHETYGTGVRPGCQAGS